jgi:MoxR-like ATPase
MSDTIKIHESLRKIECEMNEFFVERATVIHGLILSTLSKTNILLLGTPGTAKSLIINRWNQHIVDSVVFTWLLTRFTTPEEIFGPFSMKGLKEDKFIRTTTGKLPEAHIAFLDENFKASSGLLNSLLAAMNERIFYNGDKVEKIPLFTLAGASNEVPEREDRLDAIYDRYLLKYNITSIREDSNFAKMLQSELTVPKTTITVDDIYAAQKQTSLVTVDEEIIKQVLCVRTALHDQAIMISDRAFRLMIDVVKAEAWLRGSSAVEVDDLEILQHSCWQDPDTIKKVQLLILDVIAPERHKIQELFNDSLDIINEFWKTTKTQKKSDQVIEVGGKIKVAKQTISKYRDELKKKGKPTKEIEDMEHILDTKQREIYTKTLGVDLTS